MSRNEGKIEFQNGIAIDAERILAEIERSSDGQLDRRDAVARYLSGSDGWKEALALLDGAFASPAHKNEG